MAACPLLIQHRPLPQDDPRQRQPDISKAHEILGWKPKTELKDGLKHTVAYFKDMIAKNAFVPAK